MIAESHALQLRRPTQERLASTTFDGAAGVATSCQLSRRQADRHGTIADQRGHRGVGTMLPTQAGRSLAASGDLPPCSWPYAAIGLGWRESDCVWQDWRLSDVGECLAESIDISVMTPRKRPKIVRIEGIDNGRKSGSGTRFVAI